VHDSLDGGSIGCKFTTANGGRGLRQVDTYPPERTSAGFAFPLKSPVRFAMLGRGYGIIVESEP